MGDERGARAARAGALAVLRVRGRGLAVALLPAAAAVILISGGASGHLTGGGWDIARWVMTGVALFVLLAAAGVAAVIVRARPALTPTVEIAEASAPDLYRMVRDLAARLSVPAPSAIALTPDCDSWLEDRTHPAHRSARMPGAAGGPRIAGPGGAAEAAPVLVIGSPFLWWMRVGELRAVLAPVVAGTSASAHPDIAAARRFVRGLDAAVALADQPGIGAVRRLGARAVGAVARPLLTAARGHAAEMERGVAVAASERAQTVDYGLRIVAQEQVGLAYAGWDRLLTRVALPAWRMGRWPSRLDAGVVSALTELSRRDRLAEGFTSRLAERPACDLLEEPGLVDEATSLLAARLFHGGPAETGPDWAPVDWERYPEEVVDRKWRTEAARLQRVLDAVAEQRDGAGSVMAEGAGRAVGSGGVTVPGVPEGAAASDQAGVSEKAGAPEGAGAAEPPGPAGVSEGAGSAGVSGADGPVEGPEGPTLARVLERLAGAPDGDRLAAVLTAEVAREDAAQEAEPVRGGDELPLVPLQPPRTGRDLLADHVTAMVCCAAVDTAGAVPGLDWLDGPTLLVPDGDGDRGGTRRADVAGGVLTLVEDGDVGPLREWLSAVGVRPEKPVRLA
ncbi:hypothetical protein I3F58_21860 [Streptomyces sp. MUM 203J]|uniref:hypothetical protein n=1 Tax=Streptomyces sp. MUM 203J TaxID=2791990 RepID=UPI001F035B25|nr:hypothetical protein [Streptomyces sp. MUM 203J]MCH0542149.1 hypothetical protein [Streptomyces sp. MUM 203J]